MKVSSNHDTRVSNKGYTPFIDEPLELYLIEAPTSVATQWDDITVPRVY